MKPVVMTSNLVLMARHLYPTDVALPVVSAGWLAEKTGNPHLIITDICMNSLECFFCFIPFYRFFVKRQSVNIKKLTIKE